MEISKKECKHHGITEHVKRKDGRVRCKKCNVDAVDKRRKQVKLMAIAYKGGACQECGYHKCADAIDFHHLNPNEKDFGIGNKGYTRSWDKLKEELDKCVMLCANCHREVHAGLVKL
jgi:5-methylcytosine-specific restriction endonuclease McrA